MSMVFYGVTVLLVAGMLVVIRVANAGGKVTLIFLIILIGGTLAGLGVANIKSNWTYTDRQVYADDTVWVCDDLHMVCQRQFS